MILVLLAVFYVLVYEIPEQTFGKYPAEGHSGKLTSLIILAIVQNGLEDLLADAGMDSP